MKVIVYKKSARFFTGYWQFFHPVVPGVKYLNFDKFPEKMKKFQEMFECYELDSKVLLYNGEDLNGKSLLFLSLGGYGDALCFLQALNTLQRKFPTAQIDVSVNFDMYYLLKQFNFKGGWLNSPTLLEYFQRYDYYQSSDVVDKMEDINPYNIARLYSSLFHVPVDLSNSPYTPCFINQAVKVSDTGRKKVAIQVDSASGTNRQLPEEYVKQLVKALTDSDYEVYLSGYHKGLFSLSGPRIFNMVNRLGTIADVVYLYSQMDVVISPDSAGAHIGGMLRKPTVVLFNITNIEKVDHYPTVIPLSSRMSCVPCFQLSKCRMGYEKCQAFLHESVAPEVILDILKEIK